MGFPDGTSGEEPAYHCRRRERRVLSLGGEDPLEAGMATHSSILAWRIPMDRGAWWPIVHRVAKSWILLKRLSMHSCTHTIYLALFHRNSFQSKVHRSLGVPDITLRGFKVHNYICNKINMLFSLFTVLTLAKQRCVTLLEL